MSCPSFKLCSEILNLGHLLSTFWTIFLIFRLLFLVYSSFLDLSSVFNFFLYILVVFRDVLYLLSSSKNHLYAKLVKMYKNVFI